MVGKKIACAGVLGHTLYIELHFKSAEMLISIIDVTCNAGLYFEFVIHLDREIQFYLDRTLILRY